MNCHLIRVLLLSLIVSSAGIALSQERSGEIPRVIRYSGTLKQVDGTPRTGMVGISFGIYADDKTTVPLWQEVQNVTVDADGHYSVLLGAALGKGLPDGLFATNDARWLGIRVEGEPEQPRTLLAAVPYALKAADAETLAGKPLSAFVLNPSAGVEGTAGATGTGQGTEAGSIRPMPLSINTSGSSGTQNFLAMWTDNAGTLGNSSVAQSGANVGVGTTSPNAPLQVGPDFTLSGAWPTMGYNLYFNGGWKYATSGSGTLMQQDYTNNGLRIAVAPAGAASAAATLADAMFVASTGNVGLGTTSPLAPMQVGPDLTLSGAWPTMGFNLYYSGGWKYATTNSATLLQQDYVNNGLTIATAPSGTGGTAATPTSAVFVAGSGKVGIGTTSPAQKLDVNGNINASGNLTAALFTGSGAGLTSLPTANLSGVVAMANGGTGITSAPSTGQYLKSNGAGSWTNGSIAVADLPSLATSYIQNGPGSAQTGSININGAITAGGIVTGIGSGLTSVNAASLGGVSSSVLRLHLITYLGGCDSCSVLTTLDNQNLIYQNLLGATLTFQSITCYSDAGAPSINIQRDTGSGTANVTASAISCSTSGNTVSSFSVTTINANDKLNFLMSGPDGTARRVTVIIKATL
jgi:trimeric autotransporter adhesin